MIAAAAMAFSQILSPPFRGVLVRSVLMTLAMLAVVWVGLYATIDWLVEVSSPWLATTLHVLTGIGLVIGLGFLVAPVTSMFAGLFLDEVAEEVERVHYPGDPAGRAMPIGESIASALRFTVVVVLVNILVLFLLLLPGINIAAFFIANAYLLGREYFEAVAFRFHDRADVKALRSRHGVRIFLAGLVIAGVLAIPFVNLLTPLFATAFMVHIYKATDRTRLPLRRDRGAADRHPEERLQ